jgi:hypothetical protein
MLAPPRRRDMASKRSFLVPALLLVLVVAFPLASFLGAVGNLAR